MGFGPSAVIGSENWKKETWGKLGGGGGVKIAKDIGSKTTPPAGYIHLSRAIS